MDGMSRRKIEMGTRALEFSRANPDTDAGYGVAAAKLAQLVGQAEQLAAAQRDGFIDVRAAAARKRRAAASDAERADRSPGPGGSRGRAARSTSWGRPSGSSRGRPPCSPFGPRRGVWRPRRRPIAKCW